MDETGQSGDTGPAESGTGADSRDRALLNGWATSDSAWSNAGSALDPEEDVPAWRRSAQEVRPFTRQNFPPERGADGNRPFGTQSSSGEVRPFGSPPNPFGDSSRSGEVRPFPDAGRSGDVPRFSDAGASGEIHSFGDSSRSGEVRSFGDDSRSGEVPYGDDSRSGEVGPPAQDGPAPRWSNSRYSDLLHHFAPVGEPTGAPLAQTPPAQTPPAQTPLAQTPLTQNPLTQNAPAQTPAPQTPAGQPPVAQTPAAQGRPDSLEDDDRRATLSPLDAPPPSSAPPYPYEGDLSDDRRAAAPVVQQRAAVPLERPQRAFPAVRPATPGGRRIDWSTPEPARHALDPTPPPEPRQSDQATGSAEPIRDRPAYDPVSFPRRLPYSAPMRAGSAPPADTSIGYVAPTAFSGFIGRSVGEPGGKPAGEQTARALPQRVPAEPDVPTVPEPPSVEPPAETPALARIATHLRRGDVLSSQERQEGFDVKAILAAVREVDGVRDASLRSTPAGAHSLRLDLAEGADPAEVSRQVARLLQDRMGLDAAMKGGEASATRSPSAPTAAQPVIGSAPANTPPASAFVPTQAGPSGRASVPKPSSTPVHDDLRRLPTAPQAGPGPMTVDETPIRPVSSLPVSPAQISPAQVSAAQRPEAQVSPAQIPQAQIPQAQIPQAQIPQAQVSPATASAPLASATGTASVSGPTITDPVEGQGGTVETVSSGVDCGPRPLDVREQPGPRVVIENVQVNTFGTEATVEVRLAVGSQTAAGIASGPAVDGYLLRLCAMATTAAVDELLATSDHSDGPARCFVEHAASVPFGGMQVAVVVLLLSCGGNWVEQLAGSAVVSGDDRHAMVRATLAAVNRRLEALLS